jgi:HAD superfamily hydrolase (TIGR01509 family)
VIRASAQIENVKRRAPFDVFYFYMYALPMSKFTAVIFDLDGLIVDTEPLHRRAFNLILRACGAAYEFSADEYGRIFTGRVIHENAEYVRERFGLAQNANEIAEGHRALYNLLIADAENIQTMPGLMELLAYLGAQNLRVAIASSSRPEQIHVILRGLKLPRQFDVIVGNDGALKPKPAPDVYLRAASQLGVAPAQAIALEDSHSGVRAARAAGIAVFAIPNDYTKMQDFSNATAIYPDLNAVREFFSIRAR